MKMHDDPGHEWNDVRGDAVVAADALNLGDESDRGRVPASARRLWNPLHHPISLSLPHRAGPLSAWKEHIPFGMVLVDLVRPRVIVELGTYSGESYCAFCQAVRELRLATRCYAIDTWKGDPHAGFYGPETLDELREHHDALYGGFSRLIQSTFDDALAHFDHGSIDLLHLDGHHTYEAVRHDVESWLPKLSARAVIILHDTNVRERDFGVWRFWQEVKGKYPSLEFPFGHGLGVLAVGEHVPARLSSFLRTRQAKPAAVDSFFHRLGQHIALRTRAAVNETALKNHIGEQEKILRDLTEGLRSQLQEASQRGNDLERKLGEAERDLRSAREDVHRAGTERDVKENAIRTLSDRVAAIEADAASLRDQLRSRDRVVRELFDIIAQKDADLREIRRSAAWSLVEKLTGLRKVLVPAGTRRERLWKKCRQAIGCRLSAIG
jgi:O-antigen biosynthesis protein